MTEQYRFRSLSLGFAALVGVCLASMAPAAPAPAVAPAAPAAAATPVSAARAYQIDSVHSSLSFTIRHLVSRVAGNFREFGGTLNVDPKSIGMATGEFVAKTASVDTGNEDRDGHLQSEDFFNAEKFPEIKFAIASVTMAGDGAATVKGNFTMLGVTKPVDFAVKEIAFAEMGPIGVMGFSGQATINRKDFGMQWNKVLDSGGVALGDEVTITLLIEAKAAPASAGL